MRYVFKNGNGNKEKSYRLLFQYDKQQDEPIKREEDGSRNVMKKNIDMMILRQLFIMIRHIKEIFPINTGTVIL